MESYISGEIRKGDLILAIFHNYTEVGFFLGKGSGLAYQYYGMASLTHWLTKTGGVGKPPYKSYMSNGNEYRILKYSPELMNDKTKDLYERSLEALKLIKI